MRPFHIAFPVDDLVAARRFYRDVLGCAEGRSDADWIDFDLYGHQIVAHRVDAMPVRAGHSGVDGHAVPVPHFGVVLTFTQFDDLAARLVAADTRFVIEPTLRFAGLPGEQKTMFFTDPAGNALEFKAFADDAMLFATG